MMTQIKEKISFENEYIIPSDRIIQVDGLLEEDQSYESNNTNHLLKLRKINIQEKTNQRNSVENYSKIEVSQNNSFLSVQKNEQQMNSQNSIEGMESEVQLSLSQSVLMYFQNCKQKISSIQTKQIYASEILKKIKNQIKDGDLQVKSSQRHLKFDKDKDKNNHILMKQILNKKYQTIKKLKEIQNQEINLISQRSFQKPKFQKSIVTPENQQKVIQILKLKKQFQIQLQKRKNQLFKSARQSEIRQQKLQNQERQIQNKKKKQKILQHLKQLQEKSDERKQWLKKSTVKKPTSYLYLQNKKKEQKHILENIQSFEQKLKQIHKQHQLDIEQIKNHEKKYQRQLEASRARSQSVSVQNLGSNVQRYQNYFYKLVDKQIHQQKEKFVEKARKIKEHKAKYKIAQYQTLIDEKHKPKIDPSLKIILIPRTLSSISLTKQERVQKGLEYLQIAKQLKRSSSLVSSLSTNLIQQPKFNGYKDYTKQFKRIAYDPTQSQFKQIISNKQEISNYHKAMRAKHLADGLEAKVKMIGDKKMYFSMKNKLQLLEGLY